jgi:hypothetical protein
MQFWDLGRRDEDEDGFWATRRSRPYQTMDAPYLFDALPRPHRWISIALFIAAVIVSIYFGL